MDRSEQFERDIRSRALEMALRSVTDEEFVSNIVDEGEFFRITVAKDSFIERSDVIAELHEDVIQRREEDELIRASRGPIWE